MPTRHVVLVHGAWHGAWCWDAVVQELEHRSVPVTAIDLPGHGADHGALTDLHGDAAQVCEHLDRIDGPVVLVGHSYGGAVVTEAGVHPKVEHLVYVAAFNLDADETVMTAAAGDPEAATIDHAGRPDPRDYLEPAGEGATTVTADGARVMLYNTCPADVAEWATKRLSPQSMASFEQTPAAVGWRAHTSTYVVCTHDNIVHPDLQRIIARRATTTVEWPTDHSPFLSHPGLVADLLAGLSR